LNADLNRRNGVPKPSNLRELILRCRVLLEMAAEPGTIDQLRLWVIELQDQSEGRERSAVEVEVPIGAMGRNLPSGAPCGFRARLHQLGVALIPTGTKSSNPAA
jgi:hypothetical protein